MRVLLLDDGCSDSSIADVIRSAGFIVEAASSEEQLVNLIPCSTWAAIVVSVTSATSKASDIVQHIRTIGHDTPMLMLSEASEPAARVVGLRMGADDTMSVPFDKDELLARLGAVIRRSRKAAPTALKLGPLSLNLASHDVAVGGSPVALTIKEFELLHFLIVRKGTVLTKAAILDHLYQGSDQPDAKIIDVFICKLRKKLAQAGVDNLIGTVWGQGYMLMDPSGGGLHHSLANQVERPCALEAAA